MLTLLSHLTEIPQCDAVLKQAYRQQKTLQWKKLGLELQIERRLDAIAAMGEKIRSKELELDHARSVAAPLPQTGPDPVKGLELEIAMLNAREKKLHPQWVVEKEWRLRCVEAGLEEISLLILELETHKAQLQKQAVLPGEVPAGRPEDPPDPLIVPVIKTAYVQKEAGLPAANRIVPVNGYRSG